MKAIKLIRIGMAIYYIRKMLTTKEGQEKVQLIEQKVRERIYKEK